MQISDEIVSHNFVEVLVKVINIKSQVMFAKVVLR
jgi:hypothetical protein